MSTSTSDVDTLLAAVDREWRALGIHRRDRTALASDLRTELDAAAADGLDPAELLGSDPGGVFYGGVAAVVVGGAVLAVRVVLRDAPRVRHTVARMALLLPPALAAGIAAAVALGWALNFPLTPLAIGAEAALVLAAFLAATALARRWSVTASG
ncbi:hypothetical protein [Micromonospora sp. DT31]|uniref:hypothetical protein n=1 Tax=Micromonospora sp. DT31 TaxID=3393434 RepID=UPI003CF971A3